jgi:hypothetical protein
MVRVIAELVLPKPYMKFKILCILVSVCLTQNNLSVRALTRKNKIMVTQAYFDNIKNEIIKELNEAGSSIKVAVAWLTDGAIFTTLCKRAGEGIQVELILLNDSINKEMVSFDHSELEKKGGKIYFIDPLENGGIMHHKFCVIDGITLITGSYNWSNKAAKNDENIVIARDAGNLGMQFVTEFDEIKIRSAGFKKHTERAVDLHTIIKRMEVIKTFILLKEKEDIAEQIKKLQQEHINPAIEAIIDSLKKEKYTDGLRLIETFIKNNSEISVYEDVELFALKLEYQSLEVQLNALENEKIEIEKILNEFNIHYNKELGAIILEILELKKANAKTEAERDEAAKDQESFKKEYEARKDQVIPILSEQELKELKKAYREASMLCHPDKMHGNPEMQRIAAEVFTKLTEAYQMNNVHVVAEILNNLKSGNLNISAGQVYSEKNVLKMQILKLQEKIKREVTEINDLKKSETYQIIGHYADWKTYIADTKSKLLYELQLLKAECKP